MNATVEINEFWRVGRCADPLAVNVRYQGAGRFDDPEHLVAVLYGAPSLRTCLLEFTLPWQSAPQAPTILAAIPPPTDEDEAADAEQDRQLASEPRRHIGDGVVALAADPFTPQLAIIAREPITLSHAELIAIASELQLVP